MLTTADLSAYLVDLLNVHAYQDYCPNGLQVSGRLVLKKIVTGVSANQALLDRALKADADAVLVHHGFFWRGEEPQITGVKRSRLATLIKNDVNLFAYHLPLDGHDILGNNIQLANLLNIVPKEQIPMRAGPGLLRVGELDQPITGEVFSKAIEHHLQRKPFYVPARTSKIKRIAWCTGAAQDFLEQAAGSGIDAFLTGEVSERTVSLAEELGVHFYAAGHHATERYGVLALGEHLQQKFGIAHEFIDIDNPI